MSDPTLTGIPVNPDDGSFFAAPGAMAPSGASTFASAGLHPTESLGPFGGWKCPRCLQDNSGRLELGCAHCPAGRPGQQGQQAPPLRGLPEIDQGPRRRDTVEHPIERLPTDPPVAARRDATVAQALAAFDTWFAGRLQITPADRHGALHAVDGLLRDCWLAAWFAQAIPPPTITPEPTGVGGGAASLAGGYLDVARPVVRRTLVAALNHFVDTVLAAAPDDVAAGVWLSPDDVQQLVQSLEGVE